MNKKFRILLTAIYKEKNPARYEEIGIASIAAVLRENGYEVILMGGTEPEIDYDKIIDFQPDIIGGPLYSASKKGFYKFCLKIKEYLPGTYTCTGGFFPTFNYREILAEADFIDFIIRGEGEFSFLDLVSYLEKKKDLKDVKGLIYREGTEVIVNEERELIADLDILPLPARDFSIRSKAEIVPLSTTRGCLGNCTFCLNRSFWKKWRGRSVKKVLEEIKYLYKLGFKNYYIMDVSFEDSDENNYERIKKIARGIIDENLDITYRIDVRAEFYKKVDPQILKLLRKSGLRIIMVGIETNNEEDLELYGKIASLEDNRNCIDFYRNYSFWVDIGFINFNPYSNFEGLRQNAVFLEKYYFSFDFVKFTLRYRLTRGSRLYEKLKNDGLLGDGKYDDVTNYRFVDERIGILYDFITSYAKKVEDSLKTIHSREFFLTKLFVLKEKIKNDLEVYRMVCSYEKEIRQILDELNKKNADIFRELLNLSETSWDERKALKITLDEDGQNIHIKKAGDLGKKSIELLRKIYSMRPGYSNMLKIFFYDNYRY
ncbi:MAG: cobalamin-dependent protein [Candidatus Aminicenantes bacterium]|nr:MAG: cobalamin-dependent protein [Candidatus Aminicenantes bacterium]